MVFFTSLSRGKKYNNFLGPEDLKYLKLHQQTADLAGTTGTVRIVKGNAQRVNVKGLVAKSCLTLCDPMDCSPTRLLCPWDSPGKDNGVSCHALLQGIFPTQGSNLNRICLLHWQAGFFTISATWEALYYMGEDIKIILSIIAIECILYYKHN